MTIQQLYRDVERLYCQTDWKKPEDVARYNEKVKELQKMREQKGENNHE